MLSATNEEKIRKEWLETPMLTPKVRKVTVNISLGQSGEPLEKAGKVLQQLTGQKPVKRKAKRTNRDFGIRKGEPISCIVTLRKEKAMEFLRKALQAVDNRIPESSFDKMGNFSFGIKEHIEIPGTKYMPDLGIFGMDISVTLGRAGYRVKERKRAESSIGKDHLLGSEDAIVFVKDALGVDIT
ncbi:MAG: 50S ribosomal protein L5 [Candidatus Bathyarchaeota archaeon]|nr:MAG: 50S ribosomal protein L5 [Candidatus Bathyarchaeota archaeon]